MKDVIWKVHSCSESGNTMVGEYFFLSFFPRILIKYIFLVSTSFCVGEFGRRWFWLLVWKNGLWRGYNFSRFWEAKIKTKAIRQVLYLLCKKISNQKVEGSCAKWAACFICRSGALWMHIFFYMRFFILCCARKRHF